jgi:peptidoglycan-associated lipoprotein
MEPFLIWTAIILALPFIAAKPQTTILLWDNNTTHNAIDVTTSKGSLSIDKPYYYTTLSTIDKRPTAVEKADRAKIDEKFGLLVNALPVKAVSLLFYFEPTTSELTQASKDQIRELVRVIETHEPAAVDIIGHTDRAGESDKNYELALNRAKEVEKFLMDQQVVLSRCNVVSHGEDDPVIVTEDGVSESQNRRVEVIVR